jgi:plastocyanin
MKVRIVLPLVAIALAACGGSSTAPIPPAHFSGISITNSGFSPVVDTVQTNTLVTWTVTSGDQHHVIRFTSNVPSGSNPNSSDLSVGQSAATTFLQTGTFQYDDSLHTGNTGTVLVQ